MAATVLIPMRVAAGAMCTKNVSTLSSDGRINDGFIRTFTGLKFYHLNPQPDAMCIEDIAHSLSHTCRFVGMCREFYSVAQHSVLCSWIVPPEHAQWALQHENEESWYGDWASPMKFLPGFDGARAMAKQAQAVSMVKFGLPATEPAAVKAADMLLLVTEQRDLMPHSDSSFPGITPLPYKIVPWSCRKAERVFLLRFAELTGVELRWFERWYLRWIRGGWAPQITT